MRNCASSSLFPLRATWSLTGPMHRHPRDDQPAGEQQAQRTGRPSAAQHIQDGRGAGGDTGDERSRADDA